MIALSPFAIPAWRDVLFTLMHTLWQGTAIALILAVALAAMPARRSGARHAVSLFALAAIVVCALLTLTILHRQRTSTFSAPADQSGELRHPARETAVGATTPIPSMASAALTSAQSPTFHTLIPAASVVYLFGVLLMLARAAMSLAGAERLRARCFPIEDTALLGALAQLMEAVGVRGRIHLLSGPVGGAAVIGVLRPAILIPISYLSAVPPDQLRAIIAHELAHIRRHDFIVNLCQMVVEALLFFNPAVWWISRQVRTEREACCDALASQALGRPVEYVRTLAEVAAHSLAVPAGAMAFAENSNRGSLADRVRRLLDPQHTPPLRLTWRGLMGGMTISMVAIFLVWQGVDGSVALAAKLMSPQERVDEIAAEQAKHPSPAEVPGAEGNEITVSGRVIFPQRAGGYPRPPDVFITSTIPHMSWVSGAVCDKDGKYSQRIHQGSLSLRAQLEGFAPVLVGPLETTPGKDFEIPDITLNEGFTGRILFVNEKGNPVAGVRATAVPNQGANGTPLPPLGESNAEGIIEWKHAAAIPLTVSIIPHGYEIDRAGSVLLSKDAPYRWKLRTAQPTTGIVVDHDSAQPIAGAQIRMLAQIGSQRITHGTDPDSLERADSDILAVTNEAGEFTLDQLRQDSSYGILVQKEGKELKLLKDVVAGQSGIRAELGPELFIAGQVIGESGALGTLPYVYDGRVAQEKSLTASLSYQDLFQDARMSMNPHMPVELSKAADGATIAKFRLAPMIAGAYTLQIGGITKDVYLDKPINDLEFDFSKKPAPSADAASAPQTREMIVRLDLPPDSPAPRGAIAYRPSDGRLRSVPWTNGEAHFALSVGSTVDIESEGTAGYYFGRARITMADGAGPYQLDLPNAVPAGGIHGAVFNADGSAAGDATIEYITLAAPALMTTYRVGNRGPLDGSPSGGYDIKVSDHGDFFIGPLPLGGTYVPMAVKGFSFRVFGDAIKLTEENSSPEVTLRFPKPETIEGIVQDDSGAPVPFAETSLSFMSGSTSYGFSAGSTGPDGAFKSAELNPDFRYDILVSPRKNYTPATISHVKTGASLHITVKKGNVLDCIIRHEDSKRPLAGVKAHAFVTGQGVSAQAEAPSDSNGRIRFSNLPAGEFSIILDGLCSKAKPSAPLQFTVTVKQGANDPLTLYGKPEGDSGNAVEVGE